MSKWRVKVEFVKQDCWIGVFWKSLWSIGQEVDGQYKYVFDKNSEYIKQRTHRDIYICIIPMFPIHISWRLRR